VEFLTPIPIFRMFSVEKAKEFYLDFLGMTLDWEHTFEPGTPVYMQVSRDGLKLHLSEHVGDSTPGSNAFVPVRDVDAIHAELRAKNYKYLRPDIVEQPWGRELKLIDPFMNRLSLCELKD
jgi:catechol 2,3-dioxygenase-like lactoylglutathione lyase family enzyme